MPAISARRNEERGRVDGDRPARADGRHERTRERRAEDHGHVRAHADNGVRLLELRLIDGKRHDGRIGGVEEREGGAVHGFEHSELPDLGVARERSAATTTCVAPATRFDPTSTVLRGSRSAITPPRSRKSTFGAMRAASTKP